LNEKALSGAMYGPADALAAEGIDSARERAAGERPEM